MALIDVSEHKNVENVISSSQSLIGNNIKIETYNTAAELIQERISLLVKNGLSGL